MEQKTYKPTEQQAQLMAIASNVRIDGLTIPRVLEEACNLLVATDMVLNDNRVAMPPITAKQY